MLSVHLRVSDAATNKPTPVRLSLVDAAGRYFAPLGRLTHFRTQTGQDVGGNLFLSGQKWAYIDGACEVSLPPGPLTIQISKGPEYHPVRREVFLGTGQLSLRQSVERWIDLRAQGWYAGDLRAHDL